MENLAIRTEQLSKKYDLATAKHRHDTLRDQLMESLMSVFRGKNKRPGNQNETSFWALRDISFEIGQGEIVGIIGHNGAGKSTLLKILSRITEPTLGRGEIFGRVGSLLEVGTGFHPELTGRENIFLNGAIIGMKREEIRRCFDTIVDFAEIDKFIDLPVKRYSSGMYVRLAFAVSAHLKPEILLVDEVLSVGDLQFQRKCMAYAEELRNSGATILFVSHNMFSIKAICKRVIWLAHGEIRADGPPDEVIPLYEKVSRYSSDRRAGAAAMGGTSEMPIHITDVQIFDESGTPRAIFEYGERMRVRVCYTAIKEIRNPNFVVALIRSDNVACCNYSTATDGFPVPSLHGDGVVEVLTPPLKIVSESYTISAFVWDKDFQQKYGSLDGPNFHIRHHLYNTHFGVFHEKGEWFVPREIADNQVSIAKEV